MIVRRREANTHLKGLLRFVPVIAVYGLLALGFWFSDWPAENFRLMIGLLILQAIPTILLHINHSRWAKDAIIEYSPFEDAFYLTRNGERASFLKSEIHSATVHSAAPILVRNPSYSVLGWGGYYFLDVTFTDGKAVRISSLLLSYKHYGDIGCGGYDREFEILPFMSNAGE